MRIAVLNEYLQTFGGGERATYAMANAIATANHAVTVVSTEQVLPSAEQIHDYFGPCHDGFRLLSVAPAELPRLLASFDLVINHTAGSTLVNPCRRGVFSCMFPFTPAGPYVRSYQRIICNSAFTARHARYRWNVENTRVVFPPGDATVVPRQATRRRRRIVSLGRFNRQGHNKNQVALVDAFRVLQSEFVDDDWQLVLIGRVNEGEGAVLEEIRERAQGLDVALATNVTLAEKVAIMDEAACYWHGAGLGVHEHEAPEILEHFGIAVVEALQRGLPALVFASGGPPEIIEHGHSGFVYETTRELALLTALLVNDPSLAKRMRRAAVIRGAGFSRAVFDVAAREAVLGGWQ